jgi:hypothetical protein
MTDHDVTHETTQDFPDGRPWLPCGLDLWRVVDRADGRTTWRLVTAANTAARSRRLEPMEASSF